MIGAVAALLVCQLTGEILARALGWPVPGPVLGLMLLFGWLLGRHGEDGDPPAALENVTETLLSHLGLLFVPAGVGVVLYLPLLAQSWLPIGLAILVGTVAGAAATGWLAMLLLRWMAPPQNDAPRMTPPE